MFITVFDFFYNWLFELGLPNFLTVDVAQWIAFGCSCACILCGIIVISLPLIWLVNRVVRW